MLRARSIRLVAAVALLLLPLAGCSSPLEIPAPMAEARFWRMIDTARGTPDPQAPSVDPDSLARRLSGLSDADLLSFEVRFADEITRLNRWPVWAAGFVACGGMAEDEFHDFRAWLIGKGRAVTDQAVTDPDGLAPYLTDEDWAADELSSEELTYAIEDLLVARFGQSRSDGFLAAVARGENADPLGHQFDEGTVDKYYPQLHEWAVRRGNADAAVTEPGSGA